VPEFEPSALLELPRELRCALAAIEQAQAQLLAFDRAELSPRQLLDLTRAVERPRRRWETLDHALIAEIDDRRVAYEMCVPSTDALLVRELHLSPGEAKARVRAAADLGPRRGVGGEQLPPLFADVATAQAAGEISAEHAAVIRRTVDQLGELEAEHGDWVQQQLVEKAATVNPNDLAKAATRVMASLDADTAMAADEHHQRQRDVSMVQRRNGAFRLSGELTPMCGSLWQVVFDALAGPKPSADGVLDPRSPGQRRHDAFEEIPALLMRAESLPRAGGLVATLLVTATADQVESGTGYATTGHGELLPVRRVLELAADAEVASILFDAHGGVLDYGRAERLAPRDLRLALAARDGGCCFPDCDRPPAWTQAHHVVPWDDLGPTALENMCLVCGFHHRNFGRLGWACVMFEGVPFWIPPASIDPSRRPLRNTRHRPALLQRPQLPLP
jgi:Domain of unknown function (DUF222)